MTRGLYVESEKDVELGGVTSEGNRDAKGRTREEINEKKKSLRKVLRGEKNRGK